jgi:phage host-nuclease inhibitor protein Gam
MKTKRIKAPSLSTRTEFDATVDEIARLTVELRKQEARRDARIQAIRTEYEPACGALIDQIKGLTLAAEKFADENRKDLFVGKAKSSETSLALFGFRIGNPTLKLLSKAWTWERVVETLESLQLTAFIRRPDPEPDKDALKQKLDEVALAKVGCRVDQSETFYIEPKEQPTEGRAA